MRIGFPFSVEGLEIGLRQGQDKGKCRAKGYQRYSIYLLQKKKCIVINGWQPCQAYSQAER